MTGQEPDGPAPIQSLDTTGTGSTPKYVQVTDVFPEDTFVDKVPAPGTGDEPIQVFVSQSPTSPVRVIFRVFYCSDVVIAAHVDVLVASCCV